MQDLLIKLGKDLEELISYAEIQPVFELEKKIKNEYQKTTNTQEKEACRKLLTKISAYLIPWISSEQFFELLQKNIKTSLASGINITERINLRILPYPEDSQDFVKLNFLKIILKNTELIGSIPISEWLKSYDKFVDYKKSNLLEKKSFFENNENAKKLSFEEKQLLLKVLDIFDCIKPNFDYKDDLISAGTQKSEVTPTSTKAPTEELIATVSMPLSEALRIYPEVGEQLVTSNKISLRSFPYPVRPSIKNWLADYTSVLGYEKHAAMDRSNYLFQGANTKNLPDTERNKLAYILKSFDENSPITLNKNTRQIIWPTNERSLPKNLTDQYRPATALKEEPKNINALQFSYSQKMPYEKKLAAPAPVKSLPREIPDEYRGMERISQSELQKMPIEKKEEQQATWGQADFWKVPEKKPVTPPVATKNLSQTVPLKQEPVKSINKKILAPPTPAKTLPQKPPIKSSPWRLPGYSTAPQSPPKNVVDLKNIQ